jgi:hypothetical protein
MSVFGIHESHGSLRKRSVLRRSRGDLFWGMPPPNLTIPEFPICYSVSGRTARTRSDIHFTTFMASILCIHGIGQQLKGEEIVANDWRAALRDGMRLAGAKNEELPGDGDIGVAFYGDLFREEITKGFDAPF